MNLSYLLILACVSKRVQKYNSFSLVQGKNLKKIAKIFQRLIISKKEMNFIQPRSICPKTGWQRYNPFPVFQNIF